MAEKDQNPDRWVYVDGVLVPPTPPVVEKARTIESGRIAREQGQIREGFANQPVAGHRRRRDRERDDDR